MWPSLIVVHDIGLEKTVELFLVQDQEMIQAFSPDASQKAFTDCVGSWCSVRRSKDFDAAGCRHSCKMLAEFPVVIPNQICWRLPKRSCLPQLLRDPGIGGRLRHIHVYDLARFEFDDEECKKRTEEEIRYLQEITGPHFCRMIAQERFPVLPTGSFGASVLHVLLDGPFTHSNFQLEKLTTDALCSPESIVGCHFFDQADHLGREPRLVRARLGFVLPEQAKELPMPAQQRLRLDKVKRLFPGPNHSGQEHQEKSVRLPVNWSLDLSMEDDELLS